MKFDYERSLGEVGDCVEYPNPIPSFSLSGGTLMLRDRLEWIRGWIEYDLQCGCSFDTQPLYIPTNLQAAK
jgi:hypothetical protein